MVAVFHGRLTARTRERRAVKVVASLTVVAERQRDFDRRSFAFAPQEDRAAQSVDPVAEADEPGAPCWIRSADAVVANRDEQDPVHAGDIEVTADACARLTVLVSTSETA